MNYFVLLLLIVQIASQELSLKDKWNQQNWGTYPKDTTDLLSIIYHRFASNGQPLSSEQFDKFVSCATGSMPCKVQDSTQGTSYSHLTDCNLNSEIPQKVCESLHKCTSGSELISQIHPTFNSTTDSVSYEDVKALLPSILYQAQAQMCQRDHSHKNLNPKSTKPSSLEVWGYGMLFVTLISACSLGGVSVMPLMAKAFYQKLLTTLIGLAVGSLAASSVFHLIPQTFKLTNTDDHHGYLTLSLFILLGIWMFFMIERILKVFFTMQKTKKSMQPSVSVQEIVGRAGGENGTYNGVETGALYNQEQKDSAGGCQVNDVQLIYESQQQAIKASFGHDEKPKVPHTEVSDLNYHPGGKGHIATVAWMIIFGDGFHNFIDGVSIGAAFQQSILTGISISLAVFCEELPHELGDFAVLLNAGMSIKQAVFYNFMSATTCYIGLIVGILLGEFTQDSTFIFAIAAGMFLYIALADMLPEMNEIVEKAAKKGLSEVMLVLLLQNIGMIIGVFSLFFLAYYQDRMSFD